MSRDRNKSGLSPRDVDQIKALFRDLVKLCGGYEAAAEFCRVGKTTLFRYGDEESEDFPALDVVIDLEAVAQKPVLTRFMADKRGKDLVLRAAAGAGADYAVHNRELMARAFAAMEEVADMVADHRCDRDELLAVEQRLSALSPLIATMIRDVRRDLDAAPNVTPIRGAA